MMKHFYRLLVNTLIANVTTSFLWFAITFWIYLETKNVMATAILGGMYMIMLALSGIFFGTLVDKHKKKHVMETASLVTAVTYVLAGIIFWAVPHDHITTIGSLWFWVFTTLILLGSVVESIRNIALSTCVTIMVDEKKRPQANGLVGMVQGLAFMVTSIFSGLAVGYLGMGWTIVIAIGFTLYSLIDLLFVTINEDHIEHDPELTKHVDIRGAWLAIRAVPGLLALVFFATLNNLVGGVFMSLLDPYGLTLTSVQNWGFVYALTSIGFMIGGGIVAKKGLGKKPLRVLLLANLAGGFLGMIMGIRESLWLLAVTMTMYMTLMPIVEAAEQTTLQKVVPLAKQGRVFGFGSSLEAMAAPITAFLIGPLAQYVVIPYMKTSEGQARWSWLVGHGQARGIALLFIVASFFMITLVVAAFRSKSYKLLSRAYDTSHANSTVAAK